MILRLSDAVACGPSVKSSPKRDGLRPERTRSVDVLPLHHSLTQPAMRSRIAASKFRVTDL
jgi:hypothetical protein